jgi:hypothetical protein
MNALLPVAWGYLLCSFAFIACGKGHLNTEAKAGASNCRGTRPLQAGRSKGAPENLELA